MGHFDVAFCADFVRGIVGADDRAELERHIAVCRACAANLRWLVEVAALTAADARYEPPAELLTRADAMFATAKPGTPELPCPTPLDEAGGGPSSGRRFDAGEESRAQGRSHSTS
jgi:anti-sigma-K factor RskA